MKTTISLKNLMLIIVGAVLMASSITGILFGLATEKYVSPSEVTLEEVEMWGKYAYVGTGWIPPEFPAAYPMLAIGVGFMIGGTIGIYGDTKRKK